nr:MFS transporter [Streptomyces alkaliphilus]
MFAHPGTAAFCSAGVVARLPMGVFTVATVIMITAHHGSYALAGAVAACGLACSAVVAPLIARLVDRHGQARVAVPAVVVSALAHLTLVLCLITDAPVWTLFVAYAFSSGQPNVGGMVRARWALVLGPTTVAGEARHRANALEQALDELCFMCGPVLAAVLCTTLFPEAGTLLGVVLMLTGTFALVAQRRTEPPAGGRPARGGGARRSSLLPALAPLLATFLCTGAIFGSMEVVTIAFAEDLGRQAWAGAVLAAQAGGSALAGLAFGLLRPTGPAGRRFALCVAAMAVLMTLPAIAAGAGSLLVLAPVLLVAGMATAPTMVSGMTLVQGATPGDRLNEGMTLAVTALLGGLALGAAGGGWMVERVGAEGTGYLVPAAAAVCAALVAVPAFARPTVRAAGS